MLSRDVSLLVAEKKKTHAGLSEIVSVSHVE